MHRRSPRITLTHRIPAWNSHRSIVFGCLLAVLLACSAEPGDSDLVLTPDTAPGGTPTIEIRNRNWPGSAWRLRLPEYVLVYGHTDENVVASVSRNGDGSIDISGEKRSHGALEYNIELKPGNDVVAIRVTMTNTGRRPLDFSASLGCCLALGDAADYADPKTARTSVLVDGMLRNVDHVTAPLVDEGRRTLLLWKGVTGLQPGDDAFGSLTTGSLVVRSSSSGERHVALAWDNALTVSYGSDYICSNPRMGVVEPGKSVTVRGKLYFFAGTEDTLLHLFESDFPGLGYGHRSEPSLSCNAGPFQLSAIVAGGRIRLTVSSDDSITGHTVTIHRKRVDGMEPNPRPTEGGHEVHRSHIGVGDEITYVDRDVGPGNLFAYWITWDGDNSDAVTVCVRDSLAWWGGKQVDEYIERLRRRFPGEVRIETYGETVSGWKIRGVRAGNLDRCVAIVGGIHAAESGPEIVLPVFEALLSDNGDLLDSVGIAVLPLINADSRQRVADGYPVYLRRNSHGVDINRNFETDWDRVSFLYGESTANASSPTYRGESPASEVETQAVVAFVTETQPEVLFSLHGPGSQLLAPREDVGREQVERVRRVADVYRTAYIRDFADTTLAAGQLHLRREMPGTLPLWALDTHGIVSFDVECDQSPECRALLDDEVAAEQLEVLRQRSYEAMRAVLSWLSNQDQ
jgi:hypothetical protein